jgi:hypothetical protein
MAKSTDGPIMLLDWQQQFAARLRAAPLGVTPGDAELIGGQAHRFSVYRDNVVGSLVDAISQTFPVVQQLVGVQFFSAVAADFVRRQPPTAPRLSRYGAAFPAWLADLPQLRELSYVADVARLEWARVDAYFCGATTSVLAVETLLSHPSDLLPELTFKPVASLRVVSAKTAMQSIWQAHQNPSPNLNDLDPWQPEDVRLLCREAGIDVERIGAAHATFLRALSDGRNLTMAAEAATATDPSFDLQAALAAELAAGSFSDIEQSAEAIRQ